MITLIAPEDNSAVAALIINTLTEFGCIGEGYASSDPEVQCMYETYQADAASYWVIKDDDTGNILGGGGYSRLKGTIDDDAICELQKLYFSPEARGRGLGKKLLKKIIDAARVDGYKEMYLETVEQMKNAQGLYFKFGFENLDTHKGATGHHQRCTVRMNLMLV